MPQLFDPKAANLEMLEAVIDHDKQDSFVKYAAEYCNQLVNERKAAGVADPILIWVRSRKTGDARCFPIGRGRLSNGESIQHPGINSFQCELLSGKWRIMSDAEVKAELKAQADAREAAKNTATQEEADKAAAVFSKALASAARESKPQRAAVQATA